MQNDSVKKAVLIITCTCVILAIDLFAWGSRAHAAESVPASAIVITKCDKVIGVIVADTEGNLHPVEPTELSEQSVNSVLKMIPDGHTIRATVPCDAQT